MTHQVALSQVAYAALRKERKSHESFSDVVLRLLEESHRARKDPASFLQRRTRRRIPVEEHLRLIEEERDAWR